MRKAIRRMRHNGLLIGSHTDGGYWMLGDIDEVFEVSEQFRKRAMDLLHSATTLESTGISVYGRQRRLL